MARTSKQMNYDLFSMYLEIKCIPPSFLFDKLNINQREFVEKKHEYFGIESRNNVSVGII